MPCPCRADCNQLAGWGGKTTCMGSAPVARSWLTVALVALMLAAPASASANARPGGFSARAQSQPAGGLVDIEADPTGHWSVTAHAPEMTFAGEVGQPVSNIRAFDGQDSVGAYHEVDFDYGARSSGIRAYAQSEAVVFTTTYVNGGANADPFPKFTALPQLPYKLSYHDTPFSPYQLNTLESAPDSPWLFFDDQANAFLISPESDFPVARMSLAGDGTLSSGIDGGVATLPPGFSHSTLLVIGSGLNRLFDTWGNTLTTLHQKTRPA